MLVPNRNFSSPEYRYGFQGQEKDDEVKGSGNSLNYTFRMHDPRVGRFFAVAPLTHDYPFYSPYSFSGNRVIDRVELEGLEPGPTEAHNENGENQVHYEGNVFDSGVGFPEIHYTKVIPGGTPISESMTDSELYKYATQRFLKEGDYTVPEGYYVDERLMEAESLVKRFFSNHAPAWQYDQTVTTVVHTNTMAGILSADQADNSAAVEMIRKADDFLWNYSVADIIPFYGGASYLRISLNNLYKVAQSRAKRALLVNTFKGSWGKADIGAVLKQFVGKKPMIDVTDSGKILYKNEATGIQIVHDPFHKYFRIENTKIQGKRKYLDLDGNVPNNVKVNGKTRGRSQAEYNEATHFKLDD